MFDFVSDVASGLVSGGVSTGISKLLNGNDKVARTEAAVADTTDTTDSSKSSGFDDILKKFLPTDSAADVSEEELFSAAAAQRIQNLKGDEGLAKYQTALDAEKAALTAPDGYVPMEKATINALNKLVADGTLSKEEGNRIYTESFGAAQLDTNTDSLFDGRGGANDPTVAVAKMSDVLEKIKSYVDRIGITPVAAESLKDLATASPTGSAGSVSALTTGGSAAPIDGGTVTPQGTTVDGSEGFLFKPVTNNEGSLAVMFAQSWTGNIAGVKLLDSAGNLIENGVHKPEGTAETGREKYTFSKQGGSYPDNISVEITFNNGTVKTYSIPDPSKRYD